MICCRLTVLGGVSPKWQVTSSIFSRFSNHLSPGASLFQRRNPTLWCLSTVQLQIAQYSKMASPFRIWRISNDSRQWKREKRPKSIYNFGRKNANGSVRFAQVVSVPFPLKKASGSLTRRNHSKKSDNENQLTDDKNLTLWQKFKQMYRDYWYVLIPVHVATSTVWITSFYYLAAMGVDVSCLFEKVNLHVPESAGNLAIAYALYKIATPARYFITVSGTTLSIHYLVQLGWIKPKPVPSRKKMARLYREKRIEVKERIDKYGDTLENTLDDARDKLKETKARMEKIAKKRYMRRMKKNGNGNK